MGRGDWSTNTISATVELVSGCASRWADVSTNALRAAGKLASGWASGFSVFLFEKYDKKACDKYFNKFVLKKRHIVHSCCSGGTARGTDD